VNPKAYAQKMKGILTRFDESEMREHTRSMGLYPSSDEVFWRMWHKARTASTVVAENLRQESRDWLISHDSKPWG
jgi:hypothetical protein